jgi:simple sugar transport system ATP-binding protein
MVMRRGRVVAAYDSVAGLGDEVLAEAMVGRRISLSLDRPVVERGARLLGVTGLSVTSDRGLLAVRGVSLELHAGEILGVAGVAGNGQAELFDALAGLRAPDAGTVELAGRDVTSAPVRERTALGLRYIPADRTRTGTSPGFDVQENLLLRAYREPPCRRGPWLALEAARERCEEAVRSFQIATSGLDQPARVLSGGNLQKVVVARELADGARVVLAMVPTRGLDAWATTEVRRRLLDARSRGAAVLLCSEDLDEVLALSDRIAVMRGGELVVTLPRERADVPTLGCWMLGPASAEAPRAP